MTELEQLKDLLVSVRAVCERRGEDTAWENLDKRIASFGIGNVTAKVFRQRGYDSCPHSDSPLRYCDPCLVSPCPMELPQP